MGSKPAILVTRPAGQAATLMNALRDRGFSAFEQPLIEIQSLSGPQPQLDRKLAQLDAEEEAEEAREAAALAPAATEDAPDDAETSDAGGEGQEPGEGDPAAGGDSGDAEPPAGDPTDDDGSVTDSPEA